MWLIIAKELGNSVKTWLKFTSIIRILKFVSQKMLPKLSLCSLQIDSNISFYRGQLSSLHVYTSNIFILQNRFIHIFHKCVKLLKWTSYDAEFILYFIIFSVAILLIIYLLQGSWYSTFFFFFFFCCLRLQLFLFLNLFLTFFKGQLSPLSIMAFVKHKSPFQLWLFLTKG